MVGKQGIVYVDWKRCCPFYDPVLGCLVARKMKLCVGRDGKCVVVYERCCGVTRGGVELWRSCSFYLRNSNAVNTNDKRKGILGFSR